MSTFSAHIVISTYFFFFLLFFFEEMYDSKFCKRWAHPVKPESNGVTEYF